MKNITFIGMLTLPLGLFINNWLPWFLFLIGVSAAGCGGKDSYFNPWGMILSALALSTIALPLIANSLRTVVKPYRKISEQKIDEALRRAADRQATPADEQVLQQAIATGALKVSKGKEAPRSITGSVVVGRNVDGSIIVTGSHTNLYQFSGLQSENLAEILNQVLANNQRIKKEATLKRLWMLFPGRVLGLSVVLLFVVLIGLGFIPPGNPLAVVRVTSIGCASVRQGIIVGPLATIKGDFTGDLRPGQSIMVYGQQANEIGTEHSWKLFGIARAEKGAWELADLSLGDAASYSDIPAKIEVVVGCNADPSGELSAGELSRLAKNAVVSPQVIDFKVVNPKLTLTSVNGNTPYNGMRVGVTGYITGTIQGSIPTGSKVAAYVSRSAGGLWEFAGSVNPSGGTWEITNIDFRSAGNPDQTVAEIAVIVLPNDCEESDEYEDLDQFKLVSVVVPPPILKITNHSVGEEFKVTGSAANILGEGERICVRITGGGLAGRKCFLAQGGSAWTMRDTPGNRVRNALSYLIEVTITARQDCCDQGCCNNDGFAALAQMKIAR